MDYSYTANGNIKIHARYGNKGLPTLKTIFPTNEDTYALLKRKKSSKEGVLNLIYGVHDSAQLVRKIFSRFLWKILKRVAKGDVFKYPGTSGAFIALKATPDIQVRKLRQMGKFKDFNIIKANFKIPRFTLDFGPTNRRLDAQIYVGSTLQDEALRNAENGLISYTTYIKII